MSEWRIVHGNCMELIDKYIDESTVIVTDPPFNIGYHYKGYNDHIRNDIYMDMVGGDIKKSTERTYTLSRGHCESIYANGRSTYKNHIMGVQQQYKETAQGYSVLWH